MSKYAIIICNNGNFTVDFEFSDAQSAKVKFHDVCKIFWNSADVLSAKVEIVDEQLNVVDDYREYIYHDAPAKKTTKTAKSE